MKSFFLKKIGVYALLMTIIIVACDNDDSESSVSHPNYRDGVFEGKNLSVTLNGDAVTSVTSVSIKSSLLDPNIDTDRDPDKFVSSTNPTYKSVIVIKGFPTTKATSTFETVSDMQGFKGTTTINDLSYDYVGEFTGHPLTTHDKQGLVLQFSSK